MKPRFNKKKQRLAGKTYCLCLLLGSLLGVPGLSHAETVYIRDMLYVPLRGGESSSHKILHQGLKSGTKLTRLEKNDTSGYSRVRTQSGQEGWIQSQYLSVDPIARILLAEAQNELTAIKARQANNAAEQGDLNAALASKSEELSALEARYAATEAELKRITDLSENVIAIEAQNRELLASQEALNDEIQLLEGLNRDLNKESQQQWFVLGAATIFVGIILGFWLARKIYHRSRGGWT